MVKSTLYTDLNPNPITSTDILTDQAAVYTALDNLFSTRDNERLFSDDYVYKLERLLFKEITPITANRIYVAMEGLATRFEPRIRIDNAQSYVIPNVDDAKYEARLVFSITGISGDFEYKGTLLKLSQGG